MVMPSIFLPSDDHIDFETSTDTGERNASSAIAPITNGEVATQTTFRRPSENLRARTETLRTSLEDQKYLQDTDVRWIITGVDDTRYAHRYVTDWNKVIDGSPSGKFVISNDIVLQPVLGVDADTKEVAVWTFDDNVHSPAIFTFTSGLKSYQGGNQLRVIWQKGAAVSATLTDAPQHILTITYIDATSTATEVGAAIAGLGSPEIKNDDSLTLWSWLLTGRTGPDYGSTVLKEAMFSAVVTDLNPSDYTFTKNREREKHQISPAVLVSFFATAANCLTETGDTLAIHYPYLSAPLAFFADDTGYVGGRRQSCTSAPRGPYVLGAGQLFNSRVEPQKIPLSIPICRRIGDDLFFVDGTLVTVASALPGAYNWTYFGENGYTIETLLDRAQVVFTARWANTSIPNDGDPLGVQAALNLLVSSLAATDVPSGTALIGVDQYLHGTVPSASPLDIATGELYTCLHALVDKINAKGSLAAAETVTGSWHFTNNLEYDSDSGTPSYTNRTDTTALKDLYNDHAAWNYHPLGGRIVQFSTTRLPADHYLVENKVLEGLYALSTVQDSASTPLVNTLVISPGSAIVGGRIVGFVTPVTLTNLIYNDDGTDGPGITDCGGGVTQRAFETLTGSGRFWCGFLYVWLRKDGTFWLDTEGGYNTNEHYVGGKWIPDIYRPNLSTTYINQSDRRLYGPTQVAGSLPQTDEGFTLGDYCLIDVVWVTQGCASADDAGANNNEGLRIATCPLVGGIRRQLEAVSYKKDAAKGGSTTTFTHPWINVPSASTLKGEHAPLQFNSTASTPGSPGIPWWITRQARAHLLVAAAITGTGLNPALGLVGVVLYYGEDPWKSQLIQSDNPSQYAVGGSCMHWDTGKHSIPYGYSGELDLVVDWCRSTTPAPHIPTLLYDLDVLAITAGETAIACAIILRGIGFYWDRNHLYNYVDVDSYFSHDPPV